MGRSYKKNSVDTKYIATLNNLQISISQFIASINIFYQAVTVKQKKELNEELLLKTEQWINHTLTNLIEVQKNVSKKKKLMNELVNGDQTTLSIEQIDEMLNKINQVEGKQTHKVIDNSPSSPWLSNQIFPRTKKR